MKDLQARLRDEGTVLCTEAADLICDLESDLFAANDRADEAEKDAQALRERVAELEASRLCRPCALGTFAPDNHCVACGGKR